MPYEEILYSRGVQWDDRGPFWLKANGGKSYISPVAGMSMPDERVREWSRQRGASINADGTITNTAAPGGSLFRERGEWNQQEGKFDQDVNWGNLASIGVGSFLTAGALDAFLPAAPAAPSVGGGGQALLEGIPAGTLPGGAASPVGAVGGPWSLPTIPGIPAGTLPGGGPAPNVTPSLPPGSYTPAPPGLGDVTPNIPAGSPRTPPSSPLSRLVDPNNLARIGSIIPALIQAAAGGGGGGGGDATTSGQLNDLLAMAGERAKRTDPLHQMVTRLAESRMPINSRNV